MRIKSGLHSDKSDWAHGHHLGRLGAASKGRILPQEELAEIAARLGLPYRPKPKEEVTATAASAPTP